MSEKSENFNHISGKQSFVPLSVEAANFLRDTIPEERIEEIAPILRRWKNRKSLKYVYIEEHYLSGSSSQLVPFLNNTLEELGDSSFEESCLCAWLLGILPMGEEEKRVSNDTLLKVLDTSSKLKFNRASILSTSKLKFARASILWRRTAATSLKLSIGLVIIYEIVTLVKFVDWHSIYFDPIELMTRMIDVGIWGALALAIPIYPLVYFATRRTDRSRRARMNAFALKSIERLGFPDSTSTLAKLSLNPNKKISIPAQQALRQILPILRSGDEIFLPSDTVPNLCRALLRLHFLSASYDASPGSLDNSESGRLPLLILSAFEEIGDARALKTVTQVSRESGSEEIIEKAKALIPLLEERARLENDRSLLLRGSQAPSNLEHLLTPATFHSSANDVELLRPVAGNDPG